MLSIRRNAVFGLLGFLLPTLVVLVAYPMLVRALGPAAFGIYLLATGMTGVLGFLDFGFSAATLQFVAEDLAREDRAGAANTLLTSLMFYGVVGGAAGSVLWLVAPWLVGVFGVQDDLQRQAVIVFRIGAVQFPIFFLITVLTSFFKGLHRFDVSTALVGSLAVLTYGGSTLGVKWANAGVVGVTAIGLIANITVLVCGVLLAAMKCRAWGVAWKGLRPSKLLLRRMGGYGSFVAVEKLAAILATQSQRLVIAAALGPAAVTIYQTAFTITVKGIAALRGALEVLSPATARLSQADDPQRFERLRRLYLRSTGLAAMLSVGGMATLFMLADPLVTWWLKTPVAAEVVPLVRLFCVGMALNGITPVAYNIIAGLRRPDINAALTLADPVLMYATLGVLALDGLTLRDFALAFSAALLASGVFYLAFCEFVVWRRWIPMMLKQRGAPEVAGKAI